MTVTIAAWLFLALALSAVAYAAALSYRPSRWRAAAIIALLLSVPTAYWAAQLPLGSPRLSAPPAGNYTVLGARIDVNVAIYVLLSADGGEPVYYLLPYTTGDANDLQSALDGSVQGDGGVQAEIGENGDAVFHEPPVTADEPKRAEAPAQFGG